MARCSAVSQPESPFGTRGRNRYILEMVSLKSNISARLSSIGLLRVLCASGKENMKPRERFKRTAHASHEISMLSYLSSTHWKWGSHPIAVQVDKIPLSVLWSVQSKSHQSRRNRAMKIDHAKPCSLFLQLALWNVYACRGKLRIKFHLFNVIMRVSNS